MKPIARGALVLAVLLAAVAAGATTAGAERSAGSPNAFTLPDAGGRPVSLGRFLGKAPVLLAFWATWCPHCAESVPALNRIHAAQGSRGLRILAINYEESPEAVNAFVRAKMVRYRVLLDSDGRVAQSYGVVGIPTYILINRHGTVVFRGYEIPEIARYLK